MEHFKKYWNFYLVGAIVLVWAVWRFGFKNTTSSAGDGSLAACLKSKGAKFYGASWCPHCNDQKKMFGADAHNLPYVECSSSIGEGQAQACIDAKITGYPTWVFADGTKQPGEMTFDQLKQKTGC